MKMFKRLTILIFIKLEMYLFERSQPYTYKILNLVWLGFNIFIWLEICFLNFCIQSHFLGTDKGFVCLKLPGLMYLLASV